MSRHRKSQQIQEGAEVDLTPMIDVVFLLIIFFLVVTQITTQENVNLRLPDALAANPEPEDAEKIFTVHVAPSDQTSDADLPENFGFFCYGHPDPKGLDEMIGILQEEGSRVDESIDYEGRPDPSTGISENMILVRCDARAPSQYFGQLIEVMAQEAKLYKIKIAILKDQEID